MKKRMLAVMLPVAAFVALAGTGFGVWVFNNTNAASAGANYTVTDAVAMDGLTLNLTDKSLTLDQNSSDDLQIAGTIGANIDIEAGGVGTATAATTNEWAGATVGETLRANYKVEVANGLSTYITVKDVTVGSVKQTTGFSFAQSWTEDTLNDSKSITVNFAWTSSKPTTMKGYTDMITAIKGKAITVTVSVSDVTFAA